MDKNGIMDGVSTTARRDLLSEQARGDHFFLEVTPRREGPLALALGGREWCGADYAVSRGTYPFRTLEYVAEGEGEIVLGDGKLTGLRAGTFFAYGPGMALRMRTTGRPMVKFFLSFAGEDTEGLLGRPFPAEGEVMRVSGHAELSGVLELLIREARGHAPLVQVLGLNLLARLRLKLEQALLIKGHMPDHAQALFGQCKMAIDERHSELRNLAEIVRLTRVQRPMLFRLFRRFQGVTPYQYLLRRKMETAARELIGSHRQIKDIAAGVGFDDPLHFSRVFKSVHGVAPARLRASLLA